jgi:D-sedoheptulose 7-phosphate isomerase
MARLAAAESGARAGDRITGLLEPRLRANESFFAAEAGRIAELCRALAERFVAGGRLLAVGGSCQAWSDAHHIAVEFVHPVIVGKRALPALALAPDQVALLARPHDIVVSFEPLTIAGEVFEPPTEDPFLRQELDETLYHVLWELVHVFFEHLGTSEAGAGASSFLYPFLDRGTIDLASVVEDVRRSALLKATEVGELRRQTLTEGIDDLVAAAGAIRRSLEGGGQLLAFGNGGSATDAMDAVADFRAAPQGWTAIPALDLSGDPAILTALANDIGPNVLFQRQLIAYGRPGDVALALSTSGNSQNIVEALGEARRCGLGTIAMVGYDGGRIAAERLADHVVVSRSEHIPRIQEAQASAYHVLRQLVEAAS